MKVIFLDVDGVLNNINTFKRRKKIYKKTGIIYPRIDFFRVKYLKEIVVNTGAKIVITSCWRKNKKDIKELEHVLNMFNLKIDFITGTDQNGIRGNEIIDWLNKHDVESFVILDDESYDLKYLEEYLVKTKSYFEDGLTVNHINEAINILNNSKKLVLNNK